MLTNACISFKKEIDIIKKNQVIELMQLMIKKLAIIYINVVSRYYSCRRFSFNERLKL